MNHSRCWQCLPQQKAKVAKAKNRKKDKKTPPKGVQPPTDVTREES